MSLTAEQQKAHDSGIGGTLASAILGLNEYQNNVDVYLLLTDPVYREQQQSEIGSKLQVKIGNMLESLVADQVVIEKGWVLKTSNETLVDEEFPFLIGHVDRLIENEDAILEIKTRGNFGVRGYGEENTDQIKDAEYIQMMHYLMLTGRAIAHLAVLNLGSAKIHYYRIDRSDEIIAQIRDNLVKFWREHIVPRIPPTPLTYADASILWPISIAKPKLADETILTAISEIKELQLDIKNSTLLLDQRRAEVAAYLQENDTLITAAGNKLCTYKTQQAHRIDTDYLRAKYPSVAKECTMINQSRVMRFSK